MPILLKGRVIPGTDRATKGTIEIRVRLLTLSYRIQLRWNTRESFWMASSWDPSNRPIVACIACREGEDIHENVIRPFAPQGAVVVRDRTGADRDPERDGWQQGIVLRYEYEVLA